MIMPFGEYIGRAISGIPSGYLEWLMENCDWNEKVREAAEVEWTDRENLQRHIYED